MRQTGNRTADENMFFSVTQSKKTLRVSDASKNSYQQIEQRFGKAQINTHFIRLLLYLYRSIQSEASPEVCIRIDEPPVFFWLAFRTIDNQANC